MKKMNEFLKDSIHQKEEEERVELENRKEESKFEEKEEVRVYEK